MTNHFDDTQSRRPVLNDPYDGVAAPPRLLFWSVIGVFVLAILGTAAGLIAFREVLQPAQQQRVVDTLPFMEAFLPNQVAPGTTLPTPNPDTPSDISPDDLLSGSITIDGGNDGDNGDDSGAGSIVPPTATITVELPMTATPSPEPTVAEPTTTDEVATTAPPQPEPTATIETAPTETSANSDTDNSTASLPVVDNTLVSLPSSDRMFGFRHEQQTWNNCGPANVTMALSYYGWQNDQTFAARFLKPGGREDRNVNPSEIVTFVNENTALRAITRPGGDIIMLKQFIAAGIPIIIETGYMPEGYDWLGHYQTVVGYDDNLNSFFLYDSFLGSGANGEGIAETYTFLDEHWQHFNRQFIVIYEPVREDIVRDILGDRATLEGAAQNALNVATEEANADPQNGFTWFNMGSSLVLLGDYDRAAAAFDIARREGTHYRMTWYQFGPFEAYYNAGRYDEVLALVDANLSNGGEYVEETYYWQGRALAAQGRDSDAGVAFRTALRRNPAYQAPQTALSELGL